MSIPAAVLFKAPSLVNPHDIELLPEVQDCIDIIIDLFYHRPNTTPTDPTKLDIFKSIIEVNSAIGNNLFPPKHLSPTVDSVAVLARQLPIIFSEIHEMVTGGMKCRDDRNASNIEEFLNGVADTEYTILGLAARLGDDCHKRSYLGDLIRLTLGRNYRDIMEGVCGEQSSKFITYSDIHYTVDLFKDRGIDVEILPTPSGVFVIKSAKDQVVNGEHYPKGKWLKGPNFERYKLPESIINEFKNCEDLYSNILAILYALRKQGAVEVLLHQVNKLNDYVVRLFGEEWKMNLTKRDEFLAMLADQVSSPKTIGDLIHEHTTNNL